MKKSVSSKSRFFFGTSLLLALLLVSISCSKSSSDTMTGMTNNPTGTGNSAGPGANEVFIQDMAFNPATITVTAGTTIKWTNKDGYAHTVTSDNNLFNSGNIGTNGTFSFTFATAGTYKYHCAIHASMTANVIVN
jgi:plastocyanin